MPVSLAGAAASSTGSAIVPIYSFTVGTNFITDITISNIPQIYKDLMLIVNARRTNAAGLETLFITPIGASQPATCNSSTLMTGDGSSATSSMAANQDTQFAGLTSAANEPLNIFGTTIYHLLNYANSTKWKPSLSWTGVELQNSGAVRYGVHTCRNTNPITSFNISTFSGSVFYSTGTTFDLYGVR